MTKPRAYRQLQATVPHADTPAQTTALRAALVMMLADETLTLDTQERKEVEDTLKTYGWTEETRQTMTILARRWGQEKPYAAALIKALGGGREPQPPVPPFSDSWEVESGEVESREGFPLCTLHSPLSTLPKEGNQNMATVPQCGEETQGMATIDEPKLARILAEMQQQPRYYGPENTKRLAEAEQLYRQGRVHPDPAGIYFVESRRDRDEHGQFKKYRVDDKACDCPDNMHREIACAHMQATVIQRKMHAPLGKSAELFDRRTAEERYAGIPPETHQDAPGDTIMSDDVVETPEAIQEPPALPDEDFPPLGTARGLLEGFHIPKRPIQAILADLSRALPGECIARKEEFVSKRTGKKVPAQDYLHWHTVVAALDAYAPGWEGTIITTFKVGTEGNEKLAGIYRLTIHAAEGAFSRDGDGMEDEDKDDYGDAMNSIVATGLKRAAAKFGLGRQQLYDRDGKTAVFLRALRDEKQRALAELSKVIEEAQENREALLTWLKAETGMTRNADLPLHAIRAITVHLQQHVKELAPA